MNRRRGRKKGSRGKKERERGVEGARRVHMTTREIKEGSNESQGTRESRESTYGVVVALIVPVLKGANTNTSVHEKGREDE